MLAAFVASAAPGLDVELLVVAHDERNFGHRRKRGGINLRGAARDHDARMGPLALYPAHRLAALPHRFGRHRTGVDDDCVGDAGFECLATYHIGFARVEATAESENVYLRGMAEDR